MSHAHDCSSEFELLHDEPWEFVSPFSGVVDGGHFSMSGLSCRKKSITKFIKKSSFFVNEHQINNYKTELLDHIICKFIFYN